MMTARLCQGRSLQQVEECIPLAVRIRCGGALYKVERTRAVCGTGQETIAESCGAGGLRFAGGGELGRDLDGLKVHERVHILKWSAQFGLGILVITQGRTHLVHSDDLATLHHILPGTGSDATLNASTARRMVVITGGAVRTLGSHGVRRDITLVALSERGHKLAGARHGAGRVVHSFEDPRGKALVVSRDQRVGVVHAGAVHREPLYHAHLVPVLVLKADQGGVLVDVVLIVRGVRIERIRVGRAVDV
mmetsp:Transcript_44576/g.112315  ORF Transcript_44576/g.112315 Transcript_44576/m.112315 type:complete len:249 (-) Transcript_44576:245-991(-)